MLRKIVLVTALVFGANATANDWDATPLIAIEGGMDMAHTPGSFTKDNETGAHGGLKLGAENDEYRAYISGTLHDINKLGKSADLGLEVQYLIPLVSNMHAFLGANGGWIRMKNTTTGSNDSRGYFGGAVGVDLELTKKFGVEVTYRLQKIDANPAYFGIEFLSTLSGALVYKLPN